MQPRPVRHRYRQWRERPTHRVSTVGVLLFAVVAVAVAVVALTTKPDPAAQTRADASPPLPTSTAAPCRPAAPSLDRVAKKLRSNASTVTILLLGDGTRDDRGAGKFIIRGLRDELPAAKVVSLARSGSALATYQHRPLWNQIRSLHPTLLELSIGIDDLRRGTSTPRAFRKQLGTYVVRLHQEVPKAGIIVSVPAALATHDIGKDHLVKTGTAQRVTRSLRMAYLAVARTHRFVVLNDVQKKITGTKADPTRPPTFLSDQVNPTARTARQITRLIRLAVTC